MTYVRTSPYYPQSNGKIERWHRSLKGECIRPGTPLSLDDARRLVDGYVEHYNNVRLNSARFVVRRPRDDEHAFRFAGAVDNFRLAEQLGAMASYGAARECAQAISLKVGF